MLSNSEFRRDMVSGDWVVIAPKRATRPEQFFSKVKRKKVAKTTCPFEDPQKSGNGEPILLYTDDKKWLIQIVPNKFPILAHKNICATVVRHGVYEVAEGVGHHEIVITHDHRANFAHLSDGMANLVFKAFVERYRDIQNDECMKYVSIFHNWGPTAGASIAHPHYQILSLPIIPPDVNRSLQGSADYFKKHKKCVHCTMLEAELKAKKRVVYQNKEAIVFAPYVSREPFEMRVFPKKHLPYFEDTDGSTMKYMVDALQKALLLLEIQLHDPDYNFFIHTAPIADKKKFSHYHWHIEIEPKVSINAGFELGTGVEVNIVDPDDAAEMLRGDVAKKK